MTMPVQQKLGRYRIQSEIAKGGMAQIYRAQLIGVEGFSKDVAIKKILPLWSQNDDFISMLIDEAKILVQLQHPNIVQVFELGKENDLFFIVMEYVPGLDLRTLTRRLKENQQKLPHNLVAYIIKQIALGLDFAHHKTDFNHEPLHIVHRDISPQNILIGCEGEVKITDFGIAKTTQKTTHTQTGVLKGKFSYMSPEQVMGEEIDYKTDLFALGLLLFELIHGNKGFDGKNDFEIIDRVKHGKIEISSSLNSQLNHILSKALAVKKEERYESALEFYHDIELWEQTFTQKCLSRNLKLYLKDNFPELWQLTKQIQTDHTLEDPTIMPSLQTASPDYTIITQAEDFSIKTKINPTFVPVQNSANDKTRVFETLPVIPPPLAKVFSFDRLALLKKSYLVMGFVILITLSSLFFLMRPSEVLESPDPILLPETSNAELESIAPLPQAPDLPPTDLALAPTPLPEAPKEAAPPEPVLPRIVSLNIKAQPGPVQIKVMALGSSFEAQDTLTKEFAIDSLPAKVDVMVARDGFKTQSQTIELTKESETQNLQFDLQALETGFLSVDSRPWAQFYLQSDSSKKYSTPQKIQALEGPQTVVVYAPSQKKTLTKKITLKPGLTTSCKANFSNKASLICH